MLSADGVTLRAPDVTRDVLQGPWSTWFNDLVVTQFLRHGAWPVSRDQEADIVRDEMANPRSLLFAIDWTTNERLPRLIGCIGLRSIDLINRSAEIGLVVSGERPRGAALTAMRLVTEHAFDRLNLYKLYAGQHEGLEAWIRKLETIGYRREGYQEAMGWRDGKPYGVVLTGVTRPAFFAAALGQKEKPATL